MRILKPLGIVVLLLALVAAGWLLRGLTVAEGSPAAGGKSPGPAAARGGQPTVVTAQVSESSSTPLAKYVGHVEAIEQVQIYAQVEGKINRVHFQEGAMVKKGELLFTIDPERYQAKARQAEATLAQTRASLAAARASLESVQAQLAYAETYLRRLKKAGPQGVVQTDVDKAASELRRYQASLREAQAKVEQLKAQVQQSEADLKVAQIDLGYTQVRSPIGGLIGRAEVTAGAYVSPGQVLMARVVREDPVRVRFAISDRDYLDLLKKAPGNRIKELKTRLILPNGDLYQRAGGLDFVGNRMNQETGTMDLRLRYANPDGRLVPDSYVQVQMAPPGQKPRAMIPQEAVMTDQKGEYVYVVTDANRVARRDLKLGDSVNGKRVVLSGIRAGETIVVQGLLSVRPGQTISRVKAVSNPGNEVSKS